MQDRYVGDVGDFQKYGLLRSLCSAAGGAVPLRLGVCWYLTDDESHNADGKHIGYLSPGNRHARSLRAADPDLYDELGVLVHTCNRSTAAVEAAGVLPAGTATVRERLTRTMTPADRANWHRSALAALRFADVVSADPDNGMTSSAPWRSHHKYAFTSELADYVKRGQSIVVYRHADRTPGGVPVQIERRLAELRAATHAEPLGAVIARRGSCRFFFVVAAERHREVLVAALDAFAERWRGHAEVARASPTSTACPSSVDQAAPRRGVDRR